MRRTVAVFALAALSWSQLVALRCDMGASAPMFDAAPRTFASVHAAGDLDRHASGPTHQPAPPPTGHDHVRAEGTPAPPHGERHGDAGGCLMILAACGAASARTVQTAILVRFPAVSVRANLDISPIPVAVSMGVETPPPRHHA
ncbi:MAG: hypothetical protein OXN92_10970 [Gammaproteobacteria bacterium]|nr:hypothetical protein [Gammaproteobacteria bacterium]